MKRKGGTSFFTKKERLEQQLALINEREEKLKLAKVKKEADL